MTNARPLIQRMVDRAIENPGLTFNDALNRVQLALRRHSLESIINVALAALDSENLGRTQKVQRLPWLALLLVKWRLLEPIEKTHFRPEISSAEFARLQDLLWNARTSLAGEPEFRAIAMIRAAMGVQMAFQRDIHYDFIRWPALIARLPENHSNRRQFEEAVGMDPESFMDLTVGVLTAARHSREIHRTQFEIFRPAYGAKVDQFLALFARSIQTLREELLVDDGQKRRGRSEVRELPFQIRFPLLQLDDDRFVSWHADVLARGIEDAAHIRMAKYAGDYTERFGAVFENYVFELIDDAGLTYIPEEALRQASGNQPVVEALIASDGCNVYVEAKMGLFPDHLLAQDHPDFLYERTKNIRRGITQAWSISDWVRSDASPFRSHATAEQDFLLLVTSREIYLGHGLLLQDLYAVNRFGYPDGELGDRIQRFMPLQNIFIVSITDFERLTGHVRASGRSLATILKEAAAKNMDALTGKYLLGMHLDGKPGRKGPELARNAFRASAKRLHKVLDPSGSRPVPEFD